ncbi:MAG: AEC family transporter [Pseudomonadota bacterium]
MITIFEIMAPLLVIALVGYVYGSRVQPSMDITNRLVMDVFVPALILHVMLQEEFRVADYAGLVFSGVAIMLLSGVAAYAVAKHFGFEWRVFTPPAMFSNWANLGLPLYVFALGDAALNGGIMLVVAGNILCFTLGIYIYSGRVSGMQILKTPVVIAVLLGLLADLLNLNAPRFISTPLEMLGQVAIPLMLFSLGVRLTQVSLKDWTQGIVMAIFAPVVGVCLALTLIEFVPLDNLHEDMLILFGVLPPAVVNFMLAEQYDRQPDQVASMIMIGNLAALVSIPLVLYLFILQ